MNVGFMANWHEDEDPAWRADAACIGEDPDLFFAQREDGGVSVAKATAICQRCPVIEECLAFGLKEHHGVWGGTSERERRQLRRRARLAS